MLLLKRPIFDENSQNENAFFSMFSTTVSFGSGTLKAVLEAFEFPQHGDYSLAHKFYITDYVEISLGQIDYFRCRTKTIVIFL